MSNTNKERLAELKRNLANELKADNPGLLYIEDLQLSIKRLELGMGFDFQMVNTNG